MTERLLITKIVRHGDRADLYARGHQYRDLQLFTLSDLADVGVDYAALEEGQETPARFWATFELSAKLNKSGNPYKNVVALERADAPATATSVDNSAVLAELRKTNALLAVIAERLTGLGPKDLATAAALMAPPETAAGPDPDDEPGPAETDPLNAAFPRYGDGTALSEKPAEKDAYHDYVTETKQPPASRDALRAWKTARTAGAAEAPKAPDPAQAEAIASLRAELAKINVKLAALHLAPVDAPAEPSTLADWEQAVGQAYQRAMAVEPKANGTAVADRPAKPAKARCEICNATGQSHAPWCKVEHGHRVDTRK